MSTLVTLEEATEKCLQKLQATRPTTVQISGPPAAGRRQLLHALQRHLEGHRPTAYLEVPSEDFDSGALALLQMGRTSQNGADQICREIQVPFSDKMQAVLTSLPGNTVVLLYAPWLQRESSTANLSRAHWRLQQLVEGLIERYSVVAVASDLPGALRLHLQKWRADTNLGTEFAHTPLAEAADRLLAKPRSNSRLEVRLAVALVALGADLKDVETILDRYQCLSPLLELLWESSTSWIKAAWKFLALSRKPVLAWETSSEVPDFDFLNSVVGKPDCLERALLRHCLGFERDGRFVLHEETIRQAKLHSGEDGTFQVAMTKAYQCWVDHFLSRQEPWLALESELHRDFHFLTSGNLPKAMFFQDQYALAGRCLSRDFQRYSEAVQCYEKAVELDPGDAYSHHYLAYNRSRVRPTVSSSEVESEYEQAISLEPTNVYWYPRYIAWLLRNGQFVKARLFWDRAIEETHALRQTDNYYDALHREVFRSAIFADYELSRRIVDDLDHRVREVDRFRRMRLLKELYRLALQHRDVVPTAVVATAHKLKLLGPHMLPPKHAGQPLQYHYAAKVDEASSDVLYLVCGCYDESGKERFFTKELTRDEFQSSHRDVDFDEVHSDTFLEVGQYGATQVIRVHPPCGLDLRDVLGY